MPALLFLIRNNYSFCLIVSENNNIKSLACIFSMYRLILAKNRKKINVFAYSKNLPIARNLLYLSLRNSCADFAASSLRDLSIAFFIAAETSA